nr:baculoviral IAP repeat-containing protein 7-like isoform X2 [Cherax quadricarinatus]
MNTATSRKFLHYDSLKFEKERLKTFINWPIEWLKPIDLALDGFYYLRKDDHCACVFCRGIVGEWEKDDIPRNEHKKHFPNCPFIRGLPVGNIPMKFDKIFDDKYLSFVSNSQNKMVEIDICEPIKYTLYLPQHNSPRRTDYLMYEERLKSYAQWSQDIKQDPKKLAEAGFFYCGLSDHVRCFHCGNGLRNWMPNTLPWNEHARWFPECTFLLLIKGQDFIDKIQDEVKVMVDESVASLDSCSSIIKISKSDLNDLMELDIMQAVISMGFPQDKVKDALERRIEQTKQPFFEIKDCIEKTLQCMEKELYKNKNSVQNRDISIIENKNLHQNNVEDTENKNLHQNNVEDTSIIENKNLCLSNGEISVIEDKNLHQSSNVENKNLHKNIENPCEKFKSEDKIENVCKICMDLKREIVFLPCFHMISCSLCSTVLELCPICRKPIKAIIKPIIS